MLGTPRKLTPSLAVVCAGATSKLATAGVVTASRVKRAQQWHPSRRSFLETPGTAAMLGHTFGMTPDEGSHAAAAAAATAAAAAASDAASHAGSVPALTVEGAGASASASRTVSPLRALAGRHGIAVAAAMGQIDPRLLTDKGDAVLEGVRRSQARARPASAFARPHDDVVLGDLELIPPKTTFITNTALAYEKRQKAALDRGYRPLSAKVMGSPEAGGVRATLTHDLFSEDTAHSDGRISPKGCVASPHRREGRSSGRWTSRR